MWLATYMIGKVAEEFNISISFELKLFKDWNKAGCHSNYSTKDMSVGKGGMDYIEGILKRMTGIHNLHLEFYGDNSKRLIGEHEI
jgi:glutamine synthetase